MKHYRETTGSDIKCVDCIFYFKHPLNVRGRCHVSQRTYAVGENNTCDNATKKDSKTKAEDLKL